MSTGLSRKRHPTYSEATLTKAIEDVKSGAALNLVSRKYKIPRSTLHSRVTKKHSSRLGSKPALSDEEEVDLGRWIERMYALGCSVSRNQISDSVLLSFKVSNKKNPFTNNTPGRNWFHGFLRRRGLSEKLRESHRRSLRGIGVDGMTKWFELLDDRLRKQRLQMLSRTRMYSVGEVSFPLHLKTNKWCLKEKGPTVLLAGNAAGQLVPPKIVFDSEVKCDLPGGWSVEANEDADVNAEVLYKYVKDQFYPWVVKNLVQLPVVLFLYEHLATYLSQVLCDFCDEKKIILAILPASPHHVTTPVEITLFHILKREYTKKLRRFAKKKRVTKIGNDDFAERLVEAFGRTKIEDHLVNGFYKCGLYPLSAERYIRACIKLKPGEKVESIVRNEEEVVVDQSSVLKGIEGGLDEETLESFRLAVDDLTWTGKAEDTNLFYLWKKITMIVDEEQSRMELESDDTDDESTELATSDSGIENQENEGTSNYSLDPKPHNVAKKYGSLSFIDNNLNITNLDNNDSIIVVHPTDLIQDTDSDEA